MDKKKAFALLTNKVCEYFLLIDTKEKKYRCGIENCSKELAGKNKSNLIAHVKRKHNNFYENNFGEAKYRILEVDPLPVKRLKFIQNCVEFVAVNGKPFTLLNTSGMKKLLENDYQSLKIGGFASGLRSPHFRSIKNHIKYLCSVIMEKIKAETDGAAISVMADGATKYGRSILGLSIQYMHHGQLKIRTVGMINMTESQTAENLMNAIIDRLKMYKIETHQLISITTDNANAMTAMVNLINTHALNADNNGNESEVERNVETAADDDNSNADDNNDQNDYSDSDNSDEDVTENLYEIPDSFFDMRMDDADDTNTNNFFQSAGANDMDISETESDDAERRQEADAILNETDDFEHILKELESRFSVHTLNINGIRCAVHTLQLAIHDALKETELTKFITKCRQICKLLNRGNIRCLLRSNNIQYRKIRLDCKTRWNSTYRMLNDLLLCHEAVEFLEPKNISVASILQDWHKIKEIVDVLCVPSEITTQLETSTLTLSDLFGILFKMEYKMQKFILNPHQHTELADVLLKKVIDRKTKLLINPAMLCSVYFDPRYCLDLSPTETAIAKRTLEKFHDKWIHRSKNSPSETAHDSFEEYQAEKRKRVSSSFPEFNELSDVDNIMSLLEKYEKNLPAMNNKEPILPYWEKRKDTDPVLYQLASMVNTIPPTQVTVERAFSILSLIYNARRTRLSPHLLQYILLINLNKDLVPGINAEDLAKLESE